MNPLLYWGLKIAHHKMHDNGLFYTLTPELLFTLIKIMPMIDPALLSSGAYYEFGVFRGFSLWFAHRAMPMMHAYGFDSFQGMPKSKKPNPYHQKKMYATAMQDVWQHLLSNGANMSNIHLIKGWFSDAGFTKLAAVRAFLPANIVVIDCDLYESTKPVLKFLRPLLRNGTIMIFDDWRMEEPSEKTAMLEFLAANREIKVEYLFLYGIYGMVLKIIEGCP